MENNTQSISSDLDFVHTDPKVNHVLDNRVLVQRDTVPMYPNQVKLPCPVHCGEIKSSEGCYRKKENSKEHSRIKLSAVILI